MFYDGGLFAKPCLTLVIPWTLTHHAPLTMGFPRQEYWIGLPFPSPGGPSNSGVEFKSHVLQVVSLLTELPVKPFKYQLSPSGVMYNLRLLIPNFFFPLDDLSIDVK